MTRALRCRQPPADRVRACVSFELSLEWAEELGLTGPLQDLVLDAAWLPGASPAECAAFAELEAEQRHAAAYRHAPSYRLAFNTMLHWVALYRMAFPNRVLFLPLHEHCTHAQHAIHNATTLTTLLRFMERHGSLAKGRRGVATAPDSKQKVISTLREFRSVEAHYNVVDSRFSKLFSACTLAARKNAAPSSDRAPANGIRTMHFVQLSAMGFVWSTFDLCLTHTSHQVCARGGEPGVVGSGTRADFKPARGCVPADVIFRSAADSQSEFPSIDFYWYPAKDTQATHRKVPIPISRRHHGPLGADQHCPYDAIWAWFQIRVSQLPPCPTGCKHETCAWATEPFFFHEGRIVNTDYMAKLGKRMGDALNISFVGGKWARIGGSTDLLTAMGLVIGQGVLRQRGRWATDMGLIYARISAVLQLEASRRMTTTRELDMSARSGWAQPTWAGRG